MAEWMSKAMMNGNFKVAVGRQMMIQTGIVSIVIIVDVADDRINRNNRCCRRRRNSSPRLCENKLIVRWLMNCCRHNFFFFALENYCFLETKKLEILSSHFRMIKIRSKIKIRKIKKPSSLEINRKKRATLLHFVLFFVYIKTFISTEKNKTNLILSFYYYHC